MAGPIVAVEPDETVGPGAYRVHFGDGNSVVASGPEGQKVYERHQAAQALRTGAAPAAAPAGPDPRFGDPALDPMAQTAPRPAPGERVGRTVAAEEQGAEPAAPADAPPTAPQSLGYTMKAVNPASGKEEEGEAFRMPDGSIGVYKAPTRGSPGGLTPLGKQTMSQYADAQQMAGEQNQKAAEHQNTLVELAIQKAEEQQARVEELKIQAQLDMQRQADEEAAIQEKVAGLEANYQKAKQQFAEARVDPNRLVNSKPGGNWILGLSAALGALGAGMARTPNFAMEFINGRIADDIRAQEAEINVKGRNADNQLADLTRALGDLSLAKKSFKQLKLEEASYEAQRVEGQYRGQEIATNARMVGAQAAAAGIVAGEERSRSFVEKTMKDNLYFQKGSAGSSGGFVRPQLGGVQAVKNLHKEEGGDGAGSSRSLSNERTSQMAADASVIELGDEILTSPVAQGDSDVFEAEGSIRSKVPLVGPALAPREFKKYEQDMQKWINLRIKAITGAGLSEQEAVRIAKGEIGENKAINRVKQGVNDGIKESVTRLRTNFAALTPEQQQAMLSTLPPSARRAVLGEK